MKSAFKSFQIFLLLCGVFGADEDEVKSVSVMEGDSVTLNPDPDKIKKFNLIEWRFGDPVIAQTVGNDITYPSHTEIFRDRLQLDQTGSLTIKNMRTKHSGLYKLQISHSTGTSLMKFNVTIYESPSVITGAEAEMKLMSVKEGDPVTLHVPQIQGDELIVWRFGDEEKLIAKADLEAKSSPLYYEEERFRDRLQLNNQTGSLIITNTRTTDSGFYTAKISSNKQTLYKRFTVTVTVPVPDSGLSGGAKAGIVVGVLLLAAAVAGVMYYLRPRTTKLPSQKWSVPPEDDVTLNPETEIQRGDEIQWLFGAEETLIAEIKGENREMTTHEGPDEIFMNRLELDEMTGSLTINEILTKHTGLYTLKIRRGRETFYKNFIVSVTERRLVMEGNPVTLHPGTAIQKGDEIQWLFDDKEQTVLTEIKNTEVTKYDGTDWRFRDRLKLNEETGSLTITKSTTAHQGYYTLKITRDRDKIYKRLYIFVEERKKTVLEGKSVTLEPAYEIQTDDEIRWMFGDEEQQTVLAELKGKTGEIFIYDDVADERFRDILDVDETTGSLIITNTRTAHSGVYKLEIISSSGVSEQTFTVTVSDKVEWKFLKRGASVTLKPDTEIQRDDQILWMFGDQDKLIAQMKGGTVETYDDVNERFRGRLKLDETGSLTITDTKTEHSGLYKLLIISSRGILVKRFKVSIQLRNKTVIAGDPVHLHTALTEIQRDDEIEWRFGYKNSLIAEIKGGTGVTHDVPDERFRDRLELDEKTGDLIIKNSTDEHAGPYKVKISSSKGNTNRTYIVNIRARYVVVTSGEPVHLHTGLTEIQRDEEIQWRFGKENSLIAEIKGGTGVTHDGPDERFRDRLELNEKTGDLTIKNSTDEYDVFYKLKISSRKGNTNRTYGVTIRARNVAVTAGESVRLYTALTEIQRDDEIEWRFGDENSLIAEIKGGTGETHDGPDERFRDKLELDEKTGDLIIKNSKAEHAGDYKLKISSRKGNTNRTYGVTIRARYVAVTAGESVRLHTGLTEIQRDDEIQWRFGKENSLIAEIKRGTGVTHDGPDERFRDRLELNEKTGDLTIKNSRAEHTGDYTLKINSSEGNTNRTYGVNVIMITVLPHRFRFFSAARYVVVTSGEPVHLHTGLTEIQRDDEIQWRFGKENSLIAKIKRGTGVTHDVPDERFRDRLELNKTTGDLIIKKSTDQHTGCYELKIRSSGGNTNRTYIVIIRYAAVTNEARTESLLKEKTDSRANRVNESVTVEMENDPLLNGEDLDVVNEEEGTSLL